MRNRIPWLHSLVLSLAFIFPSFVWSQTQDKEWVVEDPNIAREGADAKETGEISQITKDMDLLLIKILGRQPSSRRDSSADK